MRIDEILSNHWPCRGRCEWLMEAAQASNLDDVQVLAWREVDPKARDKAGATAHDPARAARAAPGAAPASVDRLDEIVSFWRNYQLQKSRRRGLMAEGCGGRNEYPAKLPV